MKKLLMIVAVMLLASAHTLAQGPKPVAEIFFDGLKRHEAALVSNAAARCSALFYVQGALMTRDAGKTEADEVYQEAASNLQLSMAMTNGAIRKNRGLETDGEALIKEAHEQTMVTMDFYTNRMKTNQLNTGEMWGQDELIKLDMEMCPMLPKLLSSEAWAKTMWTSDWSFWDEQFK